MELPLISIIISSYNQEKYINKCIDSVINQTYNNWECIVIDDGSIDRTKEIILKYVNNSKKILYIYQKNSGVTSARNLGYKLSKGQYIQFLDGDDFIATTKLQIQIEFMLKNPEISVSYTNHLHYFEKTNKYKKFEFTILPENPYKEILFFWDQSVSLPIHCAIIKRSIWNINENPFYEDYKGRYEDWLFWINITLKNVKFKYLDQELAYYRIHNTNFSSTSFAFNNFIKAAFYIAPKIPINEQQFFLDNTINYCLQKFSENLINNKIYHSISWKIAKLISKPILFFIPTNIKKLIKWKL